MSKKEKGKKGGEGKWDSEDVLQAVVIADSFNFRFLPITIEQPRALLPLVNRPLLDYTVEFLAVAGVQEIFVFCCAHADKIKAHMEKSRWMKPLSPVKIHIIISEDCPSVGDALRNIDAQCLIKSDFVLVSGDLVANMELKDVIEQHKEIMKKDKMAVMTCIYKEAKPNHPTRSAEDDIFIVTNTSDGRLLHCEKPKAKKKLAVPVAIFEENSVVDVHYDVLDCHISICASSVPQLFSDNFDYQTRHHFIRGILFNEDITGNRIYTRIISDQYAVRVSNLHTYDAISRDVIHRWVYPLVPDNITGENYSYGRHNIYLGSDVALEGSTVLEEDVVIGQGSKVGENSKVSRSSIGRDCIIGKNVSIEDSYVWDNVVVEDDCSITCAIVCSGAKVCSGVTVSEGCILSYNVVVDCGINLSPGSRLTTKKQSKLNCSSLSDSEWEDGNGSSQPEESAEPTSMVDFVGANGRGFLWRPPTPGSEEEESDDNFTEEWPRVSSVKDACNDSESSGDSSREETPVPAEVVTDNMIFYNEILDCIRSGLAELVSTENTILMINASKHAYNIPIGEVPLSVVKAIMEGPQNSSTCQASELFHYVENAVSHLQALLQHYIRGQEVELNVIQVLVERAEQYPNAMAIFPKVVHLLYDADVIEEPSIVEWYSRLLNSDQSSFTKRQELLTRIKPVVEWLNDAEEESD